MSRANPGLAFMERGTMPMSKNKKILLMLAKGGATQSDIAAALHVSKRDVSAGAKVMRECGLTFDAVSSMDATRSMTCSSPRRSAVRTTLPETRHGGAGRAQENESEAAGEALLARVLRARRGGGEARLRLPDVLRDVRRRRRQDGRDQALLPRAGGQVLHRLGRRRAHLTDKLLGTRTKVYVLVVTLPFSDKFWAEGFCDMRQKSWQEGQIHAFEEFGGVPRMWVPTTPPRRPIGPQPRGSRS